MPILHIRRQAVHHLQPGSGPPGFASDCLMSWSLLICTRLRSMCQMGTTTQN